MHAKTNLPCEEGSHRNRIRELCLAAKPRHSRNNTKHASYLNRLGDQLKRVKEATIRFDGAYIRALSSHVFLSHVETTVTVTVTVTV